MHEGLQEVRGMRRELKMGKARTLLVLVGLLLNSALLSGCDPQKAAQAVQQVAPLISALSAAKNGQGAQALQAIPQTTNPSFSNPASTSNPLAGIGAPNPQQTGGAPLGDSLGSVGKDASKAQINQLLEAAAQKYSIPPDILKAVAYQESGWRPDALSFDGQHGKGIMQIDDRFHEFAKTPDVFDPAKNIDYGANFLKDLHNRHKTWEKALKGYNGGSDYPPIVMAHVRNKPWLRWL